MFKNILSFWGGIAIGVFTIGIVQYVGAQVFPLPVGLHLEDPVAMGTHLQRAPAGALLLILLGYALGSFFGGMVAARYATQKPILYAVLVGIVLLMASIGNFWKIPHPTWFVVIAVILFVPMAFFGGMMSSKRIP